MLCTMYAYLNSHPPWDFPTCRSHTAWPSLCFRWSMMSLPLERSVGHGRIPLAHGHVTRAIRIGRAAAAWPSMHLCHLHRWDGWLGRGFIPRTKAHELLCEPHSPWVRAEHTTVCPVCCRVVIRTGVPYSDPTGALGLEYRPLPSFSTGRGRRPYRFPLRSAPVLYIRCARVAYTTKLGGKIREPVGPYYSTGQGKGILKQGFWSGMMFSMAKGFVRGEISPGTVPAVDLRVDKSEPCFHFQARIVLPRRVEWKGDEISCARCRETPRIHRQGMQGPVAG